MHDLADSLFIIDIEHGLKYNAQRHRKNKINICSSLYTSATFINKMTGDEVM